MTRTEAVADVVLTPRSQDTNSLLKGIFRECDENSSGQIDKLELGMVMKLLGNFDKKEIDAVMGQMDKNNNGKVEYEEFVNWMTKPRAISKRRLSVFEEEGPQLEALKSALQGLFHVYDRNDDGSVSIEEFRDCHCVLQGALNAYPADEGKVKKSMPILDDADLAFEEADTDHDHSITFKEFRAWQESSMEKSGLSSDRLTELVLKLTEVLQGVFHMAEEVDEQGNRHERTISENEQPTLMDLADKLAKYSRELFSRNVDEAVQEEDRSKYTNTWCKPAPGLSLRRLMQRHMREPVPTFDVKSIDVEVILCIPEHSAEETKTDSKKDKKKRRWLVKVVRTITYKTDRPTAKPDYYYAYESLQWNKLGDSKEFDQAVETLAPELRIYAVLLKEADFGTKLSWKKIVAALENAVGMDFIKQESSIRYQEYMRHFIIMTLREDGIKADDKTANEYLHSVELSPPAVMSGLTELRIVRENPLWADE